MTDKIIACLKCAKQSDIERLAAWLGIKIEFWMGRQAILDCLADRLMKKRLPQPAAISAR